MFFHYSLLVPKNDSSEIISYYSTSLVLLGKHLRLLGLTTKIQISTKTLVFLDCDSRITAILSLYGILNVSDSRFPTFATRKSRRMNEKRSQSLHDYPMQRFAKLPCSKPDHVEASRLWFFRLTRLSSYIQPLATI